MFCPLLLALLLLSPPITAAADQTVTPKSKPTTASKKPDQPTDTKKRPASGTDAKDPSQVAALVQRADALLGSSSFAAAVKEYEAALALCDPKHPRPATTALIQSRLSAALAFVADYARARTFAEQAVANFITAFGPASAEAAVALTDYGVLLTKLGELSAARSSFERALQIMQQLHGERNPKTLGLRTSLAALQGALGDRAAATQGFEEALLIQSKYAAEENADTAFLHVEYGNFLTNQGKYREAREQLELALSLRRKLLGDRNPVTAGTLDSLGRVCHLLGDDPRAQACFEEELGIYKEVPPADHGDLINALNNLGFVLGCQQQYAPALEVFRQALAVGKQSFGDNDPHAVTGYTNLSLFSAAQDDWQRAVEFADEGRHLARRRLATTLSTLSEREQLAYLSTHDLPAHFMALSLAIELRRHPRVAELSAGWLLNGKSQSQELLADRAVRAREQSDPALARISQQLKQVRDEQAKIVFSGTSRNERGDRISKLARSEEELSRRLARAGSHSLQALDWIDVGQVRSALAPGEVLVDIACVPLVNLKAPDEKTSSLHYAAWIVPSADQGEVKLIDLGDAEDIHEDILELRKAINVVFTIDRSTGLTKPAEPKTLTQAHTAMLRLSQRLLFPLLSQIRNADKLLISPDAQLWLVPWAALYLPDGRFAVEQYQISHLVSGRELLAPKVKRPSNAPLIVANPNFDLLPVEARQIAQATLTGKKIPAQPRPNIRLRPPARLGTPLPELARQVKVVGPKLAAYAGKKPAVFEGDRALETLVKAVHGPRVVLFATHGFFEPSDLAFRARTSGLGADARAPRTADNPLLRCGVLLAGCNWRDSSKGDDGILTGMEILSLDLRGTELVVLSACNTGVGDLRIGEGVASTRQAFQLAGAEAVVATLWPVTVDEANDQMSDFFARLAKGEGKAQALRSAQLAAISRLKAKYHAALPVIWAAFTITGRG